MPGEGNGRGEGCVTLPWKCVHFPSILPLHTEHMLLEYRFMMYGLRALWRDGVTFCICKGYADFHLCWGGAWSMLHQPEILSDLLWDLIQYYEGRKDLKMLAGGTFFASSYLALFGESPVYFHCKDYGLDMNVFIFLWCFVFGIFLFFCPALERKIDTLRGLSFHVGIRNFQKLNTFNGTA